MRHLLLPLLVAGMVAGAGCQRAADAAAEAAVGRASGQGVEVDRDGDRMRIGAADGDMGIATGNGIALPGDFPDDLFLPASYGVSSVMDIGGARLLSLESDGSVSSMFDSARAAMEDHGWTQTLAMQQADSAMLGFSHGPREATYTFTRHAGGPLLVGIQLRDGSSRQ